MQYRPALRWLSLCVCTVPLLVAPLPGGCAPSDETLRGTIDDDGRVGATQGHLDAVPLWAASFGYDAGDFRVARHLRFLADVNGDGLADVVGFGSDGVYVATSTGKGFETPALWVSAYGHSAGGWRVDRHPRVMADVDGDGKADIVGFGNEGVHVSLSTGSAFTPPVRWVAGYGYDAGGWRTDRHPRFLADVDGDGKADVVGFGNPGVYVSLSTGERFTDPALWVGDYGYDAGEWRVDRHPRMMADVDGDGTADVVGFGDEGVYVSLSSRGHFSTPVLWAASYGYAAGEWRVDRHPRMMADVDGDGADDVVAFGEEGVMVSRSTRSGFTAPALWVGDYGYGAGAWRDERHPRLLADVNGDGRADVVGFGDMGAFLSLSTGAAFTAPLLLVNMFGYDAGSFRVDKHPRVMADVNGDGRYDIVGFGDEGVYVKID